MNRHFLWFLNYRVFITLAMQMKMTILGYYLYQITGEVVSLGFLGLYEAIPRIGMALPAGYLVERMDKKKALLYIALAYLALCILLYLAIAYSSDKKNLEVIIYLIVFLMGVVGSMGGSASVTLFSLLIPREKTAQYSAINSNSWMMGATLGPIIGGYLLHIVGAAHSVLVIIGCIMVSIVSILCIPNKPPTEFHPFRLGHSIAQIREGIHFVFSNKVMLWAISLDLFAVLFGGCVALIPVFAQDILKVDSAGYGLLRAAVTMGSFISMVFLARNPLHSHTGKWLLVAVAMFGLCNIGFAVSTIFWLSFLFLFLAGAFDAISVVVRGTLLLLETPENMRARVSSVNSMFISSSNEIGAFESGFAAHYLGTVRSVVFGGCMTIFFVSLAYTKGKELLNYEFKNKT